MGVMTRRTVSLQRFAFPVAELLISLAMLASCAGGPQSRVEKQPPSEGTVPTETTKGTPEKGPSSAVPAKKPTTEELLATLPRLLEQGDYRGALGVFDSLDPSASEKSDIRLLKASVLVSAGQVDGARKIVQGIIDGDGQNTDALYVLSTIEEAAGREKEQQALLERIVSINPKEDRALAALGTLTYRHRVYKNAEAYYDKSLAANPKNGEALIGKARIRWQYQDPKGAEGLLNQAIAEYPRWAAPLVERARVYREAGFLKEALADLDAAKALDGTDYWIAIDRGNVLLDLGNKAEALKEFDRAHQLDPKNFLSYVYSAGIRDELEDYPGAERDYATLSTLKPDYYFAFEGLGMLKIRDQQWAEAKDAFLQAYVRSGGKANYALLAALCWLHTGKTADLRAFLEKVLTQVPRETTEWYLLRLYYEQSGDTDISVRIDNEKNANNRARLLYYLAQYYDVKGNKTLADKYFLRVRDLQRRSILEWRLNEWALEGRKL